MDENNKILQNLKDAACDCNLIREFFKLKNTKEQLKLLSEHRKILLEKLHKNQKRIDCLDYLIFKIKENEFKC